MNWINNKETDKSKRVRHCENPCTDEWDFTYKNRVIVEKSINHFKDSLFVAGRKIREEKTLHADLLLTGITQLTTVMVADKIHKHQYIQSLKPLIA